MGAPDPEVSRTHTNRRGVLTLHCNWTTTDSDDLDDYKIIDKDVHLPAYRNNTRIAIEWIEWVSASNVNAEVEFSSINDRSMILAIPEDATQGRVDFSDEPSGYLPDPDKDYTSDVILTTTGALPGDRIFMRIGYKLKGTQKPLGITVATAALG